MKNPESSLLPHTLVLPPYPTLTSTRARPLNLHDFQSK